LISFGASRCLNCLSSSSERSARRLSLPESILSPVIARTMSPAYTRPPSTVTNRSGSKRKRSGAKYSRQQLAAVQYLAVAFGFQAGQNFLRVL